MSQEKSAKFDITPKEGAIVFKNDGVEFYYPKKGSIEIVETFEFLTFAMLKLDWLAEWPHLTLIEGGKINEDENKNE